MSVLISFLFFFWSKTYLTHWNVSESDWKNISLDFISQSYVSIYSSKKKTPIKNGIRWKSCSSHCVFTLFLSLPSSPRLSLPAVGNMWWRRVSCCHAVLLGNKASVWMGWQVVKISSVWEMSVFPSTFCLLLSIICEQQTADVSAP